ncbi:nuclease [Sorangium cellulosum]|uniref:Nuclease n=1 Tax=Sorangium cellulosum TaxID=56 RepID=A0A150RU07_SORCE|nr:nuclease [Sorangium cellulosum]KYF91981.1 nuclease [Sorangium cellulosum]
MTGLLPGIRRFIGYVSLVSRRRLRRAPDLPGATFRAAVVRTVDGDTLHVRDERGVDHPIRMLSIDTPETHFLGASQGHWAEAAAARLAELLPEGAEVEIQTDEQPCDAYGRVLAYVLSGGRLINRQLLEEGLAVTYIVAPNLRHAQDFSEAARRSFTERRGMFSDPDLLLPYEFRWSMRGQSSAKLVGSLSRGEVFDLSERERVPCWDRVFFFDARDVRAPFVRIATDGRARGG